MTLKDIDIYLYYDYNTSMSKNYNQSNVAPVDAPESAKSWQAKALGSVFNRRTIGMAVTAGLLVDQFVFAGEYGGKALRSNEFTAPAAPYYEGFGAVMHFAYDSAIELGKGIHEIVMKNDNP